MPTSLTAARLRREYRNRTLSPIEVVRAHLDRIEALDSRYGCFLHVDPERAIADAERAQRALDRGEAGPLTGVPVALKDNISTRGQVTTCASRMLSAYVPPFDATVVERLRTAGAVTIGKTNLDEFGMGTSTENSAFQPTRNPWDPGRSPGGSSGGSAAAVAAELATVALGSDTGGSVRQPAAMCGIVGFKPTYGRCSRYGLIAFASSLDQIGPLARTVEDAALLAEAITGHDPRDATSLPEGPVRSDRLKEGTLRGLRMAVPLELTGDTIAPGVAEAFESTLRTLRAEGCSIEEVSLPSIRLGVTTYYIVAPAEASSNLARFDGVRYGHRAEDWEGGQAGLVERTRSEGFGHEVKVRIAIGTYTLSAGYCEAYYAKAQLVRARMRSEFESCLSEFDCVVSPTSPVTAFRIGEHKDDPLALKMLDACTIPASMGGFPSISINCGFAAGMPVGLQLTGRRGQDEGLLQTAWIVETALPGATRRPPVP